MKPKMRIVLVAEDKLSIGRWLIIIAIFGLLLGSSLTLIPDTLNGKIYQYDQQTWGFTFFGIGFFIFMMILGAIVHRRAKWPEFVTELYPDGWIKYRVMRGNYASFESGVPSDLIVRIGKYKKKYSKRRGMWYIRFNFDIFYNNKAYTAVSYGWLKEPDDIREFEKYVNYVKEQAEKNTKGKQVKITFSNSGWSLDRWNEIDYAKKLQEEKEKLISDEDDE